MKYWVPAAGADIEVEVEEAPGGLRVTAAGTAHAVDLIETVPGAYTLIVDGRCHDVLVWAGAAGRSVIVDGARSPGPAARAPRPARQETAGAARSAEVRAPMPGLLVSLPVAPGARVGLGEAVAIMEAMKMQMEIRAPQAGTVTHVHVRAGQELAAGQLLLTLE